MEIKHRISPKTLKNIRCRSEISVIFRVKFILSVLIWVLVSVPICAYSVDPRYHTYGEMTDEMIAAALEYPEICRLHTIGYSSFFQLPLLALKISDNPDVEEDEPRFLFNGVHHATEIIGVEICLYMMHDLLSRYDTSRQVKSWIDSNEIWLVPMVNPDGHYINLNVVQDSWRKNARDNNGSGQFEPDFDGVDLNRNYDFLWDYGDANPSSRTYRGPFPFSEDETRAIRDLAFKKKFVFDICYHSDRDPSLGESVYYPWLWGSKYCPDNFHIKEVAESIAFRILNDLGNAPYAPIFGRATEGGLARNWLYYAIGTFPFTIEVSTSYQPPGYRVDSICKRVLDGSYYLFKRISGPSITGSITDSATGQPIVAEVRVLEAYSSPDTIAPRNSDSIFGRYRRILKPGYYTLEIIASGYETARIESVQVRSGEPTVRDILLQANNGISENRLIRGDDDINFLVRPSFVKGEAKISWQMRKPGWVKLCAFDNTGRKICTILEKKFEPGTYSTSWQGRDEEGKRVSSGIYFLRLESEGSRTTQKIVLK
ncbi:MAG: M14 family zinc carboxypeptidase [candidate division WOR-3 bacterium]|nr:M14 family zinc carboxypeptidase [candidate division WOR-3 bacterium]